MEFSKAPKEVGGKEVSYLTSFMLGKKMYLITYAEYKKDKYLINQDIDLSTGKPNPKMMIIDTTNEGDNKIGIVISADSKKVPIWHFENCF